MSFRSRTWFGGSPCIANGGSAFRQRVAAVLAIGLALVMVNGAAIPFTAAPTAASNEQAAQGGLFIGDGLPAYTLHRLNPQTLANAGNVANLAQPASDWTISDDGSTLARLVYAWNDGNERYSIATQDGLTGPVRARFPLQSAPRSLRLSPDGSRLVVLTTNRQQATWRVFDTVGGQRLATIPFDGQCCWLTDGHYAAMSLIDTQARHLYEFVTSDTDQTDHGPAPLDLVAIDLSTGEETGRLTLPDDLAGLWQPARPDIAQDHYFQPGLAISPDGRTIAIVHPDIAAVTLIDTQRLVIERTIPIARPDDTSLVHRILSVLPLPQSAEAKSLKGTTLRAVFGPNGHRLYVFGYANEGLNILNQPTFSGLGLRVVDLQRGELIAESLAGEQIDRVLPTANGQNVYVFGPATPNGPAYAAYGRAEPYQLSRLAATSLDVQAERIFPAIRQVIVLPGSPRQS